MMTFFFYGTLCHWPLLAVVLGRNPVMRPATLSGFSAHWASGQRFPILVPDAGMIAQGVVVEDLTAEEIARLDHYEAGFRFVIQEVDLLSGEGPVRAQVYMPEPGRWAAGAPWRLQDWVDRWGAIVTEAARDFMKLYGLRSPHAVLARWNAMMVRADATVRAAPGGPVTRRHRMQQGDVEILGWRQPYAAFFAVEETDLRHRRFDGSMSAPVTRAAFISGDAAVVLPYDPVRDRVLVIEQFRMAPLARGDSQPWVLEPIAGRVDPGETPEQAARREAVEEAGIVLDDLLPVAHYYPSPGAVAEYLFTYVALADLPDDAARLGGLDTEGEDIRAHLLSFDELMALVHSGEAENGPLVLIAWWLMANRDRLRAGKPPSMA